MEQLFVREILIIFVFALIAGYIAVKLKQPPLTGYLFGGVLLSLPIFSDFVSFDISRNLAQVGVALLMFTTGVEFPISKIFSIKKSIIIGSVIHFVFFVLFSTLIFQNFGFTRFEALFISAAFSNSATVVILQLLEKGLKIEKVTSRSIISWLIIQDIAMIFVAVLMGSFTSAEAFSVLNILEAVAVGFLFIFFSTVLGKTIVPKVFEALSRLESFEILLVLSFSFCMLVAFLAEKIGLSYSLGAFLAGVMISETFVKHEIFSEVKPIKSLFSTIFYVTLGTLLSVDYLLANIFKVIFVLVALLLLKFIISFIVIVLLEKQTRKAFIMSLIMIQGGEFALILSQIGLNNDWIDEQFFSLIIIVTILSILITPFIAKRAGDWYYKLRELIRKKNYRLYRMLFVKLDRIIDVDQPEISDHVVICGFGRVGSYVGRALEKADVDYLVIDSSTETVDYCKQRGIKVIFGDASNIDVLEKADVERAVAIVIALSQEGATEIIASNAKTLNETIKVIARSHVPKEDQKLKLKGVNITVEPEFEAAISISKKLLNYYGKRGVDINEYLKKSRRRQRSKLGKKGNK